jgi:hypothetical protein
VDMTEIKAKAEADLKAAEARYEAAHSRSIAAQADEAAELENLNRMRAATDWVRGLDQPAEPQIPAPAELAQGPQTRPRTMFGKPVPEVTVTELCLGALESFGRQASTKQIRERLKAEGHELTQTQVRGAMKYLLSKKPPMVETSKGTGVWRLSKAAKSAATSFTPAASATGVSMTGENGSALQVGAVPAGAGLNSQPARQPSF